LARLLLWRRLSQTIALKLRTWLARAAARSRWAVRYEAIDTVAPLLESPLHASDPVDARQRGAQCQSLAPAMTQLHRGAPRTRRRMRSANNSSNGTYAGDRAVGRLLPQTCNREVTPPPSA